MPKAPINCTVEQDLALWVRVHPEIKPSEVLQTALESIRDMHDKPPADERKLEREIEYMQQEVKKLQLEIVQASAELSRVRAERETEHKKHVQVVEMHADLLRRQRA